MEVENFEGAKIVLLQEYIECMNTLNLILGSSSPCLSSAEDLIYPSF
jgi:hypothetical protein